MFSPASKSKLAQRALGALRIAHSFLLLEDDYDVDWEVGQDGSRQASHPHRAPLRRGSRERRPGAAPAVDHQCLSPVAQRAPGDHGARSPRRQQRRQAARKSPSQRC